MTFAVALLSVLASGVIQTTQPESPPPETEPAAGAPIPVEEDEGDVSEVLIQKPRGSVRGDIPPEVVLDAESIQAYGANDIGELLTALEPLTRSTRGRGGGMPIVLINGRRTSGFQEVSSIPIEAIERTEVLPEEVALSYGYPADQRVVNFVLKPAFQQTSAQLFGSTLTKGGRETTGVGGNYINIGKSARWNLQINVNQADPLFETERDLIRDPGSRPFDLIGNVTGLPYGAEIDPALSAAAGSPVLVAAAPAGTTTPGLADFVAGANQPRTGDLIRSRTLIAESERANIQGSVAYDLNSKTQLTVSGQLEDLTTLSYLGLPGVTLTVPQTSPFSPFANDVLLFRYADAPASMDRTTDSLNAKAGVVLDGYVGEWSWTAAGSFDRSQVETRTGRGLDVAAFQAQINAGTANPFGALPVLPELSDNTARSVNTYYSLDLTLAGTLGELPAGSVRSTFKGGFDSRSLDSRSTIAGLKLENSVSRERGYATVNLSLPLTSRDLDVLPWLGELSINFNGGYEQLSDFGELYTLGGNAFWQPFEPISLNVGYRREQGAPSVGQINDPVISTPNVPVFDQVTGQTVLVTRITGGNPGLSSDTRDTFNAGFRLRPYKDHDLTLSSTYTWNRTDDAISALPAITPELEAALPGRFVRDGSGQLISIDARALNFSQTERSDLRTGFNFSKAFGTPSGPPMGMGGRGPGGGGPGMGPRGPGGGPGGGGPRAGGGGGPRMGGGGMGFGPRPGQGRFSISLFHTWRFTDEIIVRPGLPVIDNLSGSTATQSQQEVELESRVFKDGIGGNVTIRWEDGRKVDGVAGNPDLTFGDQTKVNVGLFIDFDQRKTWLAKAPVLKGTRIGINIQNLFDTRQEVRSSAGAPPLNYQSDFLDPQGRTIGFFLRKVLF